MLIAKMTILGPKLGLCDTASVAGLLRRDERRARALEGCVRLVIGVQAHNYAAAVLDQSVHQVDQIPPRRLEVFTGQAVVKWNFALVFSIQAQPDAGFVTMGVPERFQDRVQANEDQCLEPCSAQALGKRDVLFKAEVGLREFSLRGRRARQFLPEPVPTQTGRQRAVSPHCRKDAVLIYLGRTAVVRREGAHLQHQPATGPHVLGAFMPAGLRLNGRRREFEHLQGTPMYRLAMRGPLRKRHETKCWLVERIAAKHRDGAKAASALYRRRNVAAHEFVDYCPALNGQCGIKPAAHGLHDVNVLPRQS